MCLDNANTYTLGKKINMIILLSIDILVTNMEEITAFRQRDRPQVTLGIKKNTQKINVSLEPLGEDWFKCVVLLQTTAWQFLIFRRKICLLLLETLMDHSPALSDRY